MAVKSDELIWAFFLPRKIPPKFGPHAETAEGKEGELGFLLSFPLVEEFGVCHTHTHTHHANT